jgi:hypothetical protein
MSPKKSHLYWYLKRKQRKKISLIKDTANTVRISHASNFYRKSIQVLLLILGPMMDSPGQTVYYLRKRAGKEFAWNLTPLFFRSSKMYAIAIA